VLIAVGRGSTALMAVIAGAVLVGACASPSSSPVAPASAVRGVVVTPASVAGPATSAGATSAATALPAPSSPPGASPLPPPTATGPAAVEVPRFSHVYLLVMENQGLADVLGGTSDPYLHALVARYGLATDYRGVAHPSEPNYLALFSGSTQGVADDGLHDIAAPTIADQLEIAGKTWRVFAQNVPTDCYTGATATGGPDGPGTYVRKHEPAISFAGISSDPARCAGITDFSHFDPAAADFELIVPNLCNDMHDCGMAEGDGFLASFVPRILHSAAWQDGGVLFITFDEGSGSEPVATLVIASGVRPGLRSAVPHDHYSLLRTIQDAWGLPCLANSCTANDLGEFFAGSSPAAVP
jgi:phosphatidylinositol-3-phosphatase